MDKETLKDFAARAREVLSKIAQPASPHAITFPQDMNRGPVDQDLQDIATKIRAAVDAIDRYVLKSPLGPDHIGITLR